MEMPELYLQVLSGSGIGETYYDCEKAEVNYLIAMEHSKSKEFREPNAYGWP